MKINVSSIKASVVFECKSRVVGYGTQLLPFCRMISFLCTELECNKCLIITDRILRITDGIESITDGIVG